MAMVSLKQTPKERKDGLKDAEVSEDQFPISLWLHTEEIAKLKLNDVAIKDEMMLTAKVRVTSISASEREKGDKMEHMTLTLVEGEVAKPVADKAKVLFGKDK